MASGIIQEVKDGQIVENTTSSSSASKTEKSNDLGYDQFLQILCAEMQYQDPLEPTSNTEYIAQLATFSQLESTLSMQNTIESSSANDLVGKYVIMKVTSSTTGEISYASGTVDYVLHQNGKTYLSIEDSLYDLEDLDTVADSDYMEAIMLAKDFEEAVSMLPAKYEITLAWRDTIEAMAKTYNNLSVYQKGFISEDAYNSFAEKVERLQELIKAAESSAETEGSDDSEATDETTDGAENTTDPVDGETNA